MDHINRNHKDRLFKFIFGNPGKKEWTLSLYNAVNECTPGLLRKSGIIRNW